MSLYKYIPQWQGVEVVSKTICAQFDSEGVFQMTIRENVMDEYELRLLNMSQEEMESIANGEDED